MQDVKMVLRNKMCLKDAVPTLETSAHCYVCKYAALRHSDRIVDSLCCERSFHHSCLLDISVCPYCKEAWGGLPCVACGQPPVRQADRELFFSYERRRKGRMECCGVDVHPKCHRWVGPGCGEGRITTKKILWTSSCQEGSSAETNIKADEGNCPQAYRLWKSTAKLNGPWTSTAKLNGLWTPTGKPNRSWKPTGKQEGPWTSTAKSDGL